MSGWRRVKTHIWRISEICSLVPNAGLLPNIPVFPKVPPVVLVLGWPNAPVVVVPVVVPNPVEPNAPVVPKPVAGLGAPNTLAVFVGV